MLLILSR